MGRPVVSPLAMSLRAPPPRRRVTLKTTREQDEAGLPMSLGGVLLLTQGSFRTFSSISYCSSRNVLSATILGSGAYEQAHERPGRGQVWNGPVTASPVTCEQHAGPRETEEDPSRPRAPRRGMP